jgi:hypothetical protein
MNKYHDYHLKGKGGLLLFIFIYSHVHTLFG